MLIPELQTKIRNIMTSTPDEIVKEFREKFSSPFTEGGFFWSNGNLNPDKIVKHFRNALTSFGNSREQEGRDEAVEKIKKYAAIHKYENERYFEIEESVLEAARQGKEV